MLRSLRTALPTLALIVTAGCSAGSADPGDSTEAPTGVAVPSSAAATATGEPESGERARPAESRRTMPPAQARSAGDLARRLTAAEDDVRDRSVRGRALQAAAFETQVLYRQLARRTGWQERVLDMLPPRYRPLARLHVDARRSFRSMHTRLTDRVPAWQVSEPAPRPELLGFYREAERAYGVDWEILAAINLVETGFGRIGSDSVAGAQGPMQFIPATWDWFGEGDVHDPHDAIMAAARHLAHHGADSGDVDRALYAYNNHRAYVAGVEAYAAILAEDPGALRGLHHWQILYLADVGDLWLPEGFDRSRSVPARQYAEAHPRRLLSSDTR